eukprot:3984539-Pleurochrysis_carterae.AAC.1
MSQAVAAYEAARVASEVEVKERVTTHLFAGKDVRCARPEAQPRTRGCSIAFSATHSAHSAHFAHFAALPSCSPR